MTHILTLSIMIEQIIGFLFLILGLSFLIYTRNWSKIISRMLRTEEGMMSCGMKELILGLIIISLHNIWSYSYAVIVTLLGWGMIIEGTIILLLPKVYKNVVRYFYKKSMITGLGFIMIVISVAILFNQVNHI